MEVPTIRAIRKSNDEVVVINATDFDEELYRAVDDGEAKKAKVEKSKADAVAAAQQEAAELQEKNAAARRPRKKAGE